MSRFDTYRDGFPNTRLSRSRTGVVKVALQTDGGTLVYNRYTHEQFVDLFHAMGSDPDNRVVIQAGSGDAFMKGITLDGFDLLSGGWHREARARPEMLSETIFQSP